MGGGEAEAEWSVIAGVPFEPAVTGLVGAEVSAGVGDLEVTLAGVDDCGGVGGEYAGVGCRYAVDDCASDVEVLTVASAEVRCTCAAHASTSYLSIKVKPMY